LETYSATISKKGVTTRTKVVVTSTADVLNFEDDIDKAKEQGLPIVTIDWIIACVAAGDLEDPEDEQYAIFKPKKIEAPPKKKIEEPPKKKIEEPPPKKKEEPPKKRPASSSDDEAPPTKKVKPNVPASTVIASTITSDQPLKASAESSGLPSAVDVPSSWMGVCSYPGGDDFPFRLEIHTLKAKKITGQVTWPTLKGAKTKIRGSIEGNIVKFEEYEAISGAEDVQIPSYYSGALSNHAKTISGKTVPDNDAMKDGDDDDATFKLDLVEGDDSSVDEKKQNLPVIKEGGKFTGNCVWEYPFSLKITKRSGDSLTGIIKWENQDSETKFKGTVSEQGLKFEEFELVTANGNTPHPMPCLYNGTFNPMSSTVDGKCGPDLAHMNAGFKLTIT